MTIPATKLAAARARLERGASFDAAADAAGVSVAALKAALAPKLLPVHIIDAPTRTTVVTAGPLRIEGLSVDDIARLVALCSG